jgi:cobalt-zinc-cadmium efflux system outer membrane protein
MKIKHFCFCVVLFFTGVNEIVAQQSDTVSLALLDVEKRFLTANLQLIAQKYNIDASQALIAQAKLWPNPNLIFDQNAYNQYTHKTLDFTKSGQIFVGVNQLIQTAGKRNKNIQLQTINTELAGAQFYDLLRTLKFELRSTFFAMYFKQQSLDAYDTEITSLRHTVKLYDLQYQKGNIPLKEVIRLKAFLVSLENERKNMVMDIHSDMQNLYVFMSDSTNSYIKADIKNGFCESFQTENYKMDSLYQAALENRTDLKIQELYVKQARQNISVQKANAVPDILVNAEYDRASNYIINYWGIGFTAAIPVFDRNQGNIKAAQNYYKNSIATTKYVENVVLTDVVSAYRQAYEVDNLYKRTDMTIMAEFDQLIDGILTNYQKRNISMLEFLDFYESYKNNVVGMNQMKSDRLQAIENLNYTVGVDIYAF